MPAGDRGVWMATTASRTVGLLVGVSVLALLLCGLLGGTARITGAVMLALFSAFAVLTALHAARVATAAPRAAWRLLAVGLVGWTAAAVVELGRALPTRGDDPRGWVGGLGYLWLPVCALLAALVVEGYTPVRRSGSGSFSTPS